MTTFGYARVSTPRQSLNRQVRNLLAYDPRMTLYEEEYTGRTLARPAFAKLLRRVRPGDTIVFDEVSRMSRDAADGYALYRELYDRGVGLVFLKEPQINTETYRAATAKVLSVDMSTGDDAADALVAAIADAVGRYVMALAEQQIRIAFGQSQAEVDYLSRRTREGMEVARLAGRQIGQAAGARLSTKKAEAAKPLIRRHARRYGGTLTNGECARLCGICRNTYYKYCREIDAQLAEGVTSCAAAPLAFSAPGAASSSE